MPDSTGRGTDEDRESEGLLARIVRFSEDAIISKTLDGIITSWNEGAQRIFGYEAGEVLGRHISLLFPPDRLFEEDNIIRRLKRGEEVESFESVRRRKDGVDIPVFLSIGPIRDDSGQIIGASKIARDISAKKDAEAYLKTLQDELAHVARLSAMGQMSAAIAHELNQPLTAIANYVKASRRLLGTETPSPLQLQTARDAMDRAAEQTIRAGTIIRSLREFVEKRESVRAPVDLNRIICETVMLSGSGHTGVAIRLDLAADLPQVPADKVQIEQVLLNLLRNAMEAMAGQDRREITILSRVTGNMARIEVADCGPGVAAHILAKPFQPFVTTKEKGMGVGLNMCRALVEAHGGTIRILNRPDPGAVFEILLPLAAAERQTA